MVTPLKTLMGFSVHLNVQLKFYNLPSTKVQSECRKENIILHEAAHAFLHFNELALYRHCIFARRKMEHEANVFRIDSLVREYISEYGIDNDVNVYDFMAHNKISSVNEDDVRAAFVHEDELQRDF